MKIPMMRHTSPYGSRAATSTGISLNGIGDDIQATIGGILSAPDAMKYVMYGVGALFLFMAFSGSRRR